MASHTQRFPGPGDRWAAELRRLYPGASQAKQVAKAFEVEVRTAEGWLAGRPPGGLRPLMTAWRLHGAGLVAAVLAPAPPPVQHEVRRIRREGARLQERLGRIEQTRVREKV